jgi:hypothetical protein
LPALSDGLQTELTQLVHTRLDSGPM